MTKEEAIKTLQELWRETNDSWYEEAFDMAIKELEDRPKTKGEWVDSKNAKGYVVCSNCNKLTASINRKKYNYCPFCGTDMRNGVM